VRPAKALRRGAGNRSPGSGVGGGSGRSSFQVPSGGHPGAPRAGDVLDSLAAAAAVVSGGSTGPMDGGERGVQMHVVGGAALCSNGLAASTALANCITC
jgi:hypothetical protein